MAQVPVRSDRLAIFRYAQRKTIMAERSHESVVLIMDCALLVLIFIPAVREIILSHVKGCAQVPHVVMGTC